MASLPSDPVFEIVSEEVVHKRYVTMYNRAVKFPPTDGQAEGPTYEYDVAGHPQADFHFSVTFPFHAGGPGGGSVTLLHEYAQGVNKMMWCLPTGGFDPRKHTSYEACAKAELSEEAHLAGGAWHPLLPEGHPGFAEIKWGRNRFHAFLCVDPAVDEQPGARDREEFIRVVRVSVAELRALMLGGDMLLPSITTCFLALERLQGLGLLGDGQAAAGQQEGAGTAAQQGLAEQQQQQEGGPPCSVAAMGRAQRTHRSTDGSAVQQAQDMIAAATGGDGDLQLTVRSARPLTSLWAGYGTITEVETDDNEALIVKEVHPPASSGVSHERKLRSYQVEAAFYEQVSPRLPASVACRLPHCLGVHSTLRLDGGDAGGMQLVMKDLRGAFPRSCGSLDEAHTKAALSWLAAFHAACWGADAAALGLWPTGCYWHLETRLEELQDIGRDWRALQAAAHDLDARLKASPWQTLCHGDFKTANLLFGEAPRGGGGAALPACAAYDLQYCGGGSGLKDVVYLLASGVSSRLLGSPEGEAALLRHYHAELVAGLRQLAAGGSGGGGGGQGDCVGCPAKAAQAVEGYTFEALQADFKLALLDYVRFMAGWGFWGNTSWASARARTFLADLALA
ncbi:hypothetical protein C2E20_4083 [Micractinium conductrix]|uniref:Uncharacterized protein n=1 Tax=Micractinium conductrix TaxID=554055 RepID=A0A2P6VFC9_9CHLO|nr:hypothetical protein C2E20_4083 [Micractinium conductrix]|eukprot:PSC72803.1 hypothetical protein C2E20_4083 [Micractinium conductrix]